jgi:hypothetical protein
LCLAADVTGAGSLKELRNWWDTIISQGSKIGYFVNETKSWLIIKDESQLEEAKRIFDATGIKSRQKESDILAQRSEMLISERPMPQKKSRNGVRR